MITRLDPSASGTVSWFRTYHVGLLLSAVPPRTDQRPHQPGDARARGLQPALALVIGLDPFLEDVIESGFSSPHLLVRALANTAILGLSFLVTYWLIRRAERSIATRLAVRSRPMRRTIRSLRMGHRSRVIR